MVHLQPSKFCFFFSLRQGAICIAVVETTLTAFALLLLVLGAERAQEITAEAQADMAGNSMIVNIDDFVTYSNGDNKGRKIVFKQFAEPITIRGRDEPEEHGEPDAPRDIIFPAVDLSLTYFLYSGVISAMTYLLVCLLLLYGAIRGIPRLLLPWTTLVLVSLVLIVVCLIVFVFTPFPGCKAEVYSFFLILLAIEGHSWYIVYGYYKELNMAAACRIANNILPSYNALGPLEVSRVDI